MDGRLIVEAFVLALAVSLAYYRGRGKRQPDPNAPREHHLSLVCTGCGLHRIFWKPGKPCSGSKDNA